MKKLYIQVTVFNTNFTFCTISNSNSALIYERLLLIVK